MSGSPDATVDLVTWRLRTNGRGADTDTTSNWPDCSNVGNTTELTLEQQFKQCNFINLDGKLNPAARDIHNIEDFDEMANAVFLNSLAWGITRSGVYSQRVRKYIQTWFLNEDTYMNPNLKYAQLQGGPEGQHGTHTGILDLKSMAKVASGIILLRDGGSNEWDQQTDAHFQDWCRNYTEWLTTEQQALDEKASPNNHGTYYYAQLGSLYVIANDKEKAGATADEYFSTIYQGQITQDGDQPLEHDRTRPYHYLTYNLAGAIAVGRIAEYAGKPQWDKKASSGAGIQEACNYVMNFPPKEEAASELWPYVAAVGSIYGDSDNKYSQWLQKSSDGSYFTDASYYWNQPLADGRIRPERDAVTYAVESGVRTLSVGEQPTAAPVSHNGNNKSGATSVRASLGAVVGAAVLAALI